MVLLGHLFWNHKWFPLGFEVRVAAIVAGKASWLLGPRYAAVRAWHINKY